MRQLLRRAWYLIRRRRFDADLREELDHHRAMKEYEFKAQGVAARDARIAARRALGSAALAANRSRDVWAWPWLQDVMQDVRFAARLLLKDRRFTLAAVAALALGIGATTTAFTFVNGALLRSLTLANPDRLVWIRSVDARGPQLAVSYADVRDWRESAHTLSHVIVSLEYAMNVTEEGVAPQRYSGSFISYDVFRMVGRAPMLGRDFRPGDDRAEAPRVAIIAQSVWQMRYGNDPAVIGRVVRLNDVPTTIVGVMPEGFHFPLASEVWVPLAQSSGPRSRVDAMRGNRGGLLLGLGRLADGVSLAQASAEMKTLAQQLARDYPATNAGISVRLDPIDDLYWGGLKQILLLLMGAVTVVLVIACVNVANLLLARAVHRSGEIAIRTALGASRARIVRQLLVESTLLAALAGVMGFVLSLYAIQAFRHVLTQVVAEGPPPWWWTFPMDARVYGVAAALCLGTSVLFGLGPALHVARAGGGETLQRNGRAVSAGSRARRWTGALMIGQLALTLMLLAGASLLARSFLVVYRAGSVVKTSNVLTMQLALAAQKYRQPEQVKAFFRQLNERLASIPAFSSVTVASDVPLMTRIGASRLLTIEGRPLPPGETPRSVDYLFIGPRYFDTLGLHLLRGREFTEADGAPGQETVIVNQQVASMFFPDADPIGQRIRLADAANLNTARPWFTIVGVAPTVPQVVFSNTPDPVVYGSLRGDPTPTRFVSIIVRAEGSHAAIVSALREAVRQVEPDLPGYGVETLDEILARSAWMQRVFGALFMLLAAIAVLLASVGLYATTAYGVRQRQREIGLRMALGADSASVVWLFVRRTCVQLACGLLVGLAGAIGVGRLLGPLLVRTAPTDPVALSIVSVLLIVVATMASVWPARRASRIDPALVLRNE